MNWIPNHWTFADNEVARRFDEHVRETLPWYDLATHGVAHLARAYLPDNGTLVDVGTSTGNIPRALADTIEARNINVTAYESAPEMAALYDAPGTVLTADATRLGDQFPRFDVATLFLVLMFIAPSRRQRFLDTLVERCQPGGAIIVVDKLPASDGYLGSTLHRWTMQQKRLGGIEMAEIAEKELSLSGVQRPINPEGLRNAGFAPWLRVGEFAGWLYESPLEL